jgi:predicted HicB family RNase H-like nuclease
MSDMLEYKGYLGDIEYSKADGVFYGRVLGITDHITYDGDSVKTLQCDFEEAVDDYIESCFEIGKDPEKSYEGSLHLNIHPDLHRKLVHFSSMLNQPLNKTVEDAINQYVTRPQQESLPSP